MRLFFLAFFLCAVTTTLSAQLDTATVIGKITDKDGEPLYGATIQLEGTTIATSSLETGEYRLIVPSNRHITIVYSYIGFKTHKTKGFRLPQGGAKRIDVAMLDEAYEGIGQIVVFAPSDDSPVNREQIEQIPVPSGNLEQVLLFTAAGVSAGTGGELTSQYSVRGGNYDENLVYVNGFEVYRPLLIRAGQQEGLTFPNPDMLDAFTFSSGGFKAEYGDKMSSVLDIKYRRPRKPLEGAISGSFMGANAYLGGALGGLTNNRFTYTAGVRYKDNRGLLSSQDTKGEYLPRFLDLQSNLIYDFNKHWQVEFLGNYSNSIFRLIPEDRETTEGTFNQAIQFSALFEGQEISNFETFMTGVSVKYLSSVKADTFKNEERYWNLRLLASHYQSNENERIDIISQYRLDEIETGLGEDNFGEVIGTLVYGETHQYARNFLRANVTDVQLRGNWGLDKFAEDEKREKAHHHLIQWGVKYKNEQIRDELKEWTRLDSLGYTLPYDTSNLEINEYLNTNISLLSHRFTGFVQHTWEFDRKSYDDKATKGDYLLRLTTGVRANYWTVNQEFVVSPRVQLSFTPLRYRSSMLDTTKRTKNITFKLAGGAYYQPPFYREIRDLQGNIISDTRSQKSLQALGGVVWDFMLFRRRFRFVTEGYYKHQWDLIPYDVENVRIRYYGTNRMKGYVAGIDFRLNGELVDGLESWINLSFLRAREQFLDVDHLVLRYDGIRIDTLDVLDVPKPTDRFVVFSMYFQDNLPKAEWFKANLAFSMGSGLPYGVPGNNVIYRNTLRLKMYYRVDLGFTLDLWNKSRYTKKHFGLASDADTKMRSSNHFMKHFESAWFSIEIFNLMNIANESSKTWVKDFSNIRYAISNNLTSRRINLRFRVAF